MSSVDLYCGDARDVLPTIAPDVIITDPVWPNAPENLLQAWGIEDADALWRETMEVLPPTVHRLVVILRGDSDPRFLRHVPDRLSFFRAISLDYAMPGYIGRKLGGAELAYWFGPPVQFQPGRQTIPGRGPVAQPSDRPPNGHPCSRAQVHIDWLVWWASDVGERICDPFMGSGSTGAACVKHGRDFIGIEKDDDYYALAWRRMCGTTPPLFTEERYVG